MPIASAFIFSIYLGAKYSINKVEFGAENGLVVSQAYNTLTNLESPLRAAFTNYVRNTLTAWRGQHFNDARLLDAGDAAIEQKMFDLQHPIRRFIAKKLVRAGAANMNMIKLIMEWVSTQKYPGIIFFPYANFPEEIYIGKKVKSYLTRNIQSPYDWQYMEDEYMFSTIGKLIDELRKYKTTMVQYHAGDLLEHSVWTALYVQWMFKSNHPATAGLGDKRTLAIVAAFLHDVGKAGDLVYTYYDKSPDLGAGYLNGAEFKTSDGVLDLSQVVTELGVPGNQTTLLRLIVKRSHSLFKVLTKPNIPPNVVREYTHVFKGWCEAEGIISKEDKATTFRLIYLVWTADVMAAQPFLGKDKLRELTDRMAREAVDPALEKKANYYFNEYVEDFPFLGNLPKNHKGGDFYNDWRIQDKDVLGNYINQGKGIAFRRAILDNLKA